MWNIDGVQVLADSVDIHKTEGSYIDVDAVARMESFRALNSPYLRVLGP